jgi:uncharacterized protein (DUF362 family)/Pyruvate/2-oxoacid:ferredoxin oxidoreductase delta subunit
MKNGSIVAIQKIESDDIKKAVFKGLELINAKELMKNGQVILLKPNLLGAWPPERAATTHPEVVRAVIRWIKQYNPKKIYLSDSSGTAKMGVTENAMKISGLKAVCEEEGVEGIPFEKTERKIYQVPNPLELEEITSSKLLEEVDLIINLPKIKTHGQCLLTCCIKNMFGTLLLGNKAKTHARSARIERFSAALADIYSVSKPNLTIVDGYLCQEGQGPSAGDVVKMDVILAGYDPVALDTVVCEITGINPKDVIHLKMSEKKGLGTMDLENIKIIGNSTKEVYRKFKKPKIRPVSAPLPRWLAKYIANVVFRASVKFNPDKCRLCGTCWENCPGNAIIPPEQMKKGNTPTWIKKNCIMCYCCVELCPYEAVNFKINYVKNVLMSWAGAALISVIAILIVIFILIFAV